MSTVRRAAAGATRTCPHCRTVILQSASICPACKKHLRVEAGVAAAVSSAPAFSPLRVEGSIKHPDAGEAWEYYVVVAVKNDRGEEISRHVVGVGALHPGEGRKFTLSVDVYTPDGAPGIPSYLTRGTGTPPRAS